MTAFVIAQWITLLTLKTKLQVGGVSAFKVLNWNHYGILQLKAFIITLESNLLFVHPVVSPKNINSEMNLVLL